MSHNVERAMITGKNAWWQGNQWQGEAIAVHLGENAVTSEVAMKAAGLDWLVEKVQAGYADVTTLDLDGKPIHREVPGECFLRRSSDGSILGRATMGYQEYQNAEAFRFLDSLVADGGGIYHTAGSLESGGRVWILMQLPESWRVSRRSGKTNTHHAFLLIMLGHTGDVGIALMPTDVRAECANTCGFADSKAKAQNMIFRIPHTGDVDAKLNLAATAIEVMRHEEVERREILQAMAQMSMDTNEFIDFATSIFLGLDGAKEEVEEKVKKFYADVTPRSKTIMENKVAGVTNLFERGQGNEGDSIYDALNGFTEYFDHDHALEAKNKVKTSIQAAKQLKSSWVGAGAERKALVYKRLAERVHA